MATTVIYEEEVYLLYVEKSGKEVSFLKFIFLLVLTIFNDGAYLTFKSNHESLFLYFNEIKVYNDDTYEKLCVFLTCLFVQIKLDVNWNTLKHVNIKLTA